MKTLLGPKFSSYTPESFHNYVLGLYKPRTKSGKAVDPIVKGKITVTPTKKRMGVYALRFMTALGEKQVEFYFEKDKIIDSKKIPVLFKTLLCSEAKLREFLTNKKFTFSV